MADYFIERINKFSTPLLPRIKFYNQENTTETPIKNLKLSGRAPAKEKPAPPPTLFS